MKIFVTGGSGFVYAPVISVDEGRVREAAG
jgi:hypothetical protein